MDLLPTIIPPEGVGRANQQSQDPVDEGCELLDTEDGELDPEFILKVESEGQDEDEGTARVPVPECSRTISSGHIALPTDTADPSINKDARSWESTHENVQRDGQTVEVEVLRADTPAQLQDKVNDAFTDNGTPLRVCREVWDDMTGRDVAGRKVDKVPIRQAVRLILQTLPAVKDDALALLFPRVSPNKCGNVTLPETVLGLILVRRAHLTPDETKSLVLSLRLPTL
ncbi:hypothetical protein Bbelb_035770 [Branchiostoma belcheri]|nr:hypothetical protein Bbelb_035770 [Branchiostoma belcheri]